MTGVLAPIFTEENHPEPVLRRRARVAGTNDIVAIVAGTRMATAGSTNFIRLHRIRPLHEAGGKAQRQKKINKGPLQ